MLLALVTGQRGHALFQLKVSDIKFSDDHSRCVIHYSDKHKHTRAGTHSAPADIRQFHEEKLCPVKHLLAYIEKTKDLPARSSQNRLFLSFQKPHSPISRATFSRWIKTVLETAGIDCAVFSSHSTRAASVSAASGAGVTLKTILDAAGWSGDRTFLKFYKRSPPSTDNFGQSVLDKFMTKK